MSRVLTINARPKVVFNATDKDHRSLYQRFLQTESWKYCPVQFIAGDMSLDVLYFINKELAKFYTSQEFV